MPCQLNGDRSHFALEFMSGEPTHGVHPEALEVTRIAVGLVQRQTGIDRLAPNGFEQFAPPVGRVRREGKRASFADFLCREDDRRAMSRSYIWLLQQHNGPWLCSIDLVEPSERRKLRRPDCPVLRLVRAQVQERMVPRPGRYRRLESRLS